MNQSEVWDRLYSSSSAVWRGNTVVPHPNEGRALDLGCGNGKTVSTLLDLGYETTGVDFSEVAVEQCRKRFEGSKFFVSSITDLPFEEGRFDYVTAVHVLEHLNDDELSLAVKEIRRVLKSGGYVFVRCFTSNDMRSAKRKDSDIFYRFYDIDALESAFAGFTVVKAELVEEPTRFKTLRSRVELLMKA
jgi:ubiquinone/menaquinone biosynthesis C-methylase UbiE